MKRDYKCQVTFVPNRKGNKPIGVGKSVEFTYQAKFYYFTFFTHSSSSSVTLCAYRIMEYYQAN